MVVAVAEESRGAESSANSATRIPRIDRELVSDRGQSGQGDRRGQIQRKVTPRHAGEGPAERGPPEPTVDARRDEEGRRARRQDRRIAAEQV